MHDRGQLVAGEWLQNDVYVVRHHAPSQQVVPLAVEVLDGFDHDARDVFAVHPAVAVSDVEVFLDALREEAVEFHALMIGEWTVLMFGCVENRVALADPGAQDGLRERVFKAESDGIDAAGASPMWEIGAL